MAPSKPPICECTEGKCTCVEDGDIHWETFLDTVAGLASPTFEAVVAELVDNSLDQKATSVEVELFGKNHDDFSVIVYDNGDGIANDDALKKAFSLAHFKGSKSSQKSGKGKFMKTGKFNFGLKISPVSRCDHVALMSTASGKLVHRRLDKRQVRKQKKYGTITTFLDDKAVMKARLKLEDEKDKIQGFRTAVVLSGFHKFIPDLDYKPDSFYNQIKHLCNYFGILYQKAILDDPQPKIRFSYPGSANAGKNVTPLDPFWKDFTPDRIQERLNITDENNPEFVNQGDRFILESFKEWGTISTGKMQIPYSLKNASGNLLGEPNVSVTGYCIPSRSLHSRLLPKMKNNVFDKGDAKSPSNLLGATKLGGIYFYREGRLIAFGDNNKDPDANQGWYELLSNVESRHSVIRIEIEVPIKLDSAFGLTGSKDKYSPPWDFMKQLKTNLQASIIDPQLRANIGDGTRNFWLVNAGKDSPCAAMTSVRESSMGSKGNPSKINKECEHCSGEPKPWHHIETKCSKKPCEICKKVGECESGCEYECDYCGEPHKEANCDENCQYCEYPEGAGGHPEGEVCPELCDVCEKISCTCPCPKKCGKDQSHCDGSCDEEDGQGEQKKSSITKVGSSTIILKLEKNNSAEKSNDELIEEAKKFLESSESSE